jgi:hypothetical protein
VDAARGNDANSGTRPSAPWRTLAPLAQGQLGGGDSVLLRGSERYVGELQLTQSSLLKTSRKAKLRISSYGRGRATIAAPPGEDAIAASGVAGIDVSRVNLVGAGDLEMLADGPRACRDGPSGIRVEASGPSGTLDQGVTINRVRVHGFCEGINILSRDGARISHVRVNSVESYDNGDAGIWTHGTAQADQSIRDVLVTRTRAYRNANQGGIVLFEVDHGIVTHSVAFRNATRGGGGVGIWAFDSNRITLARNESYRNGRKGLTDDGDGFDLDRGVSNSRMVHNYSHGNGGNGFLVCSCERWARFYRMRNNVVRSNVSRNDGTSGQPSFYVLGGEPMTGIRLVSNRLTSDVGDGPLVDVAANGRRYGTIAFRHNRFVAGGGKSLLAVHRRAGRLTFRNDRWRAIGGRFLARWNGWILRTPQALRTAIGEGMPAPAAP